METKNFKGKAISNPSGKAGEYSYWACNFYVGCSNDCSYCYCKKGVLGSVMGANVATLKKCFKDEEHALQVFEKELTKLQRLNHQSGEFSVQFNYLQNFIELPWNEYSKDNFDLKNARKVLDKDHYGLDDVKDRILEYLAVQSRVKKIKGPILCLVGPPGVGKTSLGESIARATGRKFVRMALGGVRDEAEIRGHRRTYIGAMPGKIVQSLA